MSSNLCNSNCASSKNWCNTETQVDEVEFDWFISDFKFHEAEGTMLKSSKFSSNTNDKFQWYLACKPNGETEKKDTISLFLHLSSKIDRKVFVLFKFSTLDLMKRTTKNIYQFNIHEFNEGSMSWGSRSFLEKNKSFEDYLISNHNKLIIRCNVRFSEMKNVDISSHQCPLKMSAGSLPEDLALLLEKKEFSDVIISVNGKEFSAHKNILAARSPVFAAMFRHNTTETEQNRVTIEDVNDEVMAQALKYIYSGTCGNLKNFAEQLLMVADKYALDGLKIMCMEELSKTLSVKNVVNILVLADLQDAKDLKNEAIKFIVSKSTEIVKTPAWNDSLLSNPQLTREVCEALARRSG